MLAEDTLLKFSTDRVMTRDLGTYQILSMTAVIGSMLRGLTDDDKPRNI